MRLCSWREPNCKRVPLNKWCFCILVVALIRQSQTVLISLLLRSLCNDLLIHYVFMICSVVAECIYLFKKNYILLSLLNFRWRFNCLERKYPHFKKLTQLTTTRTRKLVVNQQAFILLTCESSFYGSNDTAVLNVCILRHDQRITNVLFNFSSLS